jgi:3-oxoacyl-[acyl-carrier protein] reductase
MIEPAVWLASEFSDSVTGGRFIAKLWNSADPTAARSDTEVEPNIM